MIERNDTVEKVIDLVASKLGVDKAKVVPTATLEDLGADSLEVIELVMRLEDLFDIQIDDEDIEKLKTIDDLVSYIHHLRISR